MSTFVLLHGGAAGSWIWKPVRKLLEQRGHDVYALTFTGFGDRRHLVAHGITPETHVADVVNALHFEDIEDCILVAHSYSGAVVPGVLAAAGARVRRTVYLDALVLKQGESVAQAMGYMTYEQACGIAAAVRRGDVPLYSDVAGQQRAMAKDAPFRMSAERQAWMLEHLSDMPMMCVVGGVQIGAESVSKPVDYIACTDTNMTQQHARAAELGWQVHSLEGDHAVLVGDPESTARLLETFA
ncbi:alpha/beta fold hydrolase [Paraburkholderia caffeinilytica]|uniref:alpha/beta hydrolase n=1 Tax=Paraburkholderia caffeinilytica TaxID=1761016 RepID=UPI003DA14934